ncbi:hypothetical protein DL770_006033 [Monosporascus sp. CRB-9-2]|nr:hypothetical protein DL770_006033 [Monosporascus sp. CRB-9-2]
MWALTAVTLAFVALRLYTRQFILFLLLYTAFLQLALQFGFGQAIADLDLDAIALAIKWEMVGQTFAVVGMAVSKMSLGLFLLRLVVERWHRVSIWVAMLSLFGCSILTAVMFWVQCVPVQGIYDPVVKPAAKCNIPITPFAVMLGVWCVVTDFFFAIFPAVVIWDLNMKKKEKILIAASMSLGVLAGIAGIIRTREVAVGFTENYTEDTIPLIVWSAVEMGVTMVCIGIPILWPLYRRVVHGYTLPSGNASYQRQAEGNNGQAYELGRGIGKFGKGRDTGNKSKLGIDAQTITDIQTSNNDNNSNEYILAP